MKQLLALLTLAMLLTLLCPALASEAAEEFVTDAELLGVWQGVEEQDVTVLILPGSYAPLPKGAKLPQLYAYGTWREAPDCSVTYSMCLNRWEMNDDGLLRSLFGNALANAFQGVRGEEQPEEGINGFDYSNGVIGIEWEIVLPEEFENPEDVDTYAGFTEDASGTFYAAHDGEGGVMLFWMDEYDPHVAGIELRRLTVDAAPAGALTQGVLRPVIDMAEGAEAQTAMAVLRWAAENQCARMDPAALSDSFRAALGALNGAEVQAFRDNFARVSGMMLDAMSLNSDTLFITDRYKPFEGAGLRKEVEKLRDNEESRLSADVLISVASGATGG